VKGASGRFGREDRLLSARDYRRVSQTGRRAASDAFVVLVSPGEGEESLCRLGLTVSRRVGGAVTRNRIKRQVREWFRWEGRRVARAMDVVVIARRGAAKLSAPALRSELDGLLHAALER
jgi:ribonuclease P protein component